MNHVLDRFDPIALEEMSGIKLMNRTDTKFITTVERLEDLLVKAQSQYFIQEINGERNMPYFTRYFDTPDCLMYVSHQNGKKTRQKVRVRSYESTGLAFIEVKNKNNRGRTKKKRISLEDKDMPFELYNDFLGQHLSYNPEILLPQIENKFNRITLVNKDKTERLTIDTSLQLDNMLTGNKILLDRLVIIELKRDGNVYSPIRDIMCDLRIQPQGFSKYCMGMALTNESLKRNRFKERLMLLEKMQII
ncbi:MAG: polyphosphate polymerase domain-containing protein [Muribaculaceae bacterium]|nr:polyphosphate polymerase domain-containing protein [Muribaculaceae bacterium]